MSIPSNMRAMFSFKFFTEKDINFIMLYYVILDKY